MNYYLVIRMNAARFPRRVARCQSQRRCHTNVALLAFVHSSSTFILRVYGVLTSYFPRSLTAMLTTIYIMPTVQFLLYKRRLF